MKNWLPSVLGALILCMSGPASAGGDDASLPNVVIVIADDQGWGDLSAHGNPILRTPRLDALRQRAVRFDRFYADPLCAPTRAALLTGRYPLRTGVRGVTRGGETMRSEEVTIAEVLREAGYATGAFGKWHNGAHFPQNAKGQGFDTFFGFEEGHTNIYFDADLLRDGKPEATRGYITDVVTDEAAAFIAARRDAPFFAWVAFNTPHAPFQVPDADFDRYAALGLDPKLAAIYGMVENIDRNVGELLDAEAGNGRETIFVYLSDNGPNGARYNDGLHGTKGGVDEGSVRVPMFMLLPGGQGPRVIETPAAHIDLLPTLAGLLSVGTAGTLPLDGIDLSSLVRGEGSAEEVADRLLFAHRTTNEEVLRTPGTVRDARYRATLQEGAESWQLYDLLADPGQTRDLADIFPARTEALAAAWTRWFDDVTERAPSWPKIEIGHAEAPVVRLPAHEAHLSGADVRYGEIHGWSHDWIYGWNANARASWFIEVVDPGTYEVSLLAGGEGQGAAASVKVGPAALSRQIDSLLPAPVVRTPDRIARKESPARAWQKIPLGLVEIGSAASDITLRITPGESGQIDVKGLVLTRVTGQTK